jgi:hypothetical protein
MAPDGIQTDCDLNWHKIEVRRDRARYALLLLLVVGFGLTVLVFYPGYSTIDARYVYADAKAWHFGDWQSPVMAVLWRIIDPMAPGSLGMFLLTAALYWLGFGTLAFIALRSSTWLGLATPLLAFAPPAFFFVGLIWRDILFGVVWFVAGVLVFAVAERRRRIRLPLQALALCLIALGVLLRPNAIIAAPLLAIYAIWPTRFALKRTAIAFVPAAVLCYALVPIVYYGLLAAERQNPLHSIFVFDLGGITHFSGENQFPVQWSAEQTALLKSKCYDPVHWDSYWHMQPCPFVMARLERPDDLIFGRRRLLRAWRHAVSAHPLSYLAHRATFMWQFLARSNLVLPIWDWTDPSSSYGHSPYLRPVLRLHETLQPSILLRPGLWLLLAVAIGAFSWRRRETPPGAFAVGVTSCAAVYVMSFFVLGVAADFRYAYWCVLGTLAGAVAAVLARYDRSSHQSVPQRLTSFAIGTLAAGSPIGAQERPGSAR